MCRQPLPQPLSPPSAKLMIMALEEYGYQSRRGIRPDGSNVSSTEPALAPAIVNRKYDHMRMRESITHWILMHEHSFSIVEEAGFDFMMKVEISQWPGLCRTSAKNDYGLEKIKSVIKNVRDSISFINASEARTKTFNDLAQQSTYEMLSSAYKFKEVFPKYEERDPDYESCPSMDDWVKVEQICEILVVFNNVTNIISGSDYPTSNLFLCEVYKVKQVLDGKKDDENEFIRETMKKMKEKFDKYWQEVHLLMAIAVVLDPRVKMWSLQFCFPKIYEPADSKALAWSKTSSGCGFQELQNFVEVALMQKSNLDWKSHESKYRILSKLTRDILAILITTAASEATFSAGGRVIGQYRASLGVKTVQALLCGGN
ncbi:zinc finger BED domain-containing protein RICESLEEPER 2-like protein [Tanacetum coccineum]